MDILEACRKLRDELRGDPSGVQAIGHNEPINDTMCIYTKTMGRGYGRITTYEGFKVMWRAIGEIKIEASEDGGI